MFSSQNSQVSSAANYIEDVFSTYLYTGNGTSQTITNGIDLAGKGGLVWSKRRNVSLSNLLFDTVRGNTKYLVSNTTGAEGTDSPATYLTSFNSNGFSVGAAAATNNLNDTYASWTFREQPKFFDVVTWTGNGAARTIAHSLGSVPGCVLIKCTSLGGTDWMVFHRSASTGYFYLNSTSALMTAGAATFFGNGTSVVAPDATSIYLGSGDGQINQSSATYVAYLFAHNAGGFGLTGTDNVISCGSYTHNSTSGVDVNLGYEPQWILQKNAGAASGWLLIDNMRGWVVDANDQYLTANSSGVEDNIVNSSPTATGFKVDAGAWGNGANIIYIAIRRGPMKVPTSGTSVFYPTGWTGSMATRTNTTGFVTDLNISRMWYNFSSASNLGAYWETRLTGATKYLHSDATAAEASQTDGLTSFASNTGITFGADSTVQAWNYDNNYRNWSFKRAPSYMDVVCYTGTGASSQVLTHNLTVTPQLTIFKKRSASNPWDVVSGNTSYLQLNENFAASPDTSIAATATTITAPLGAGNGLNASGATYVAYLFATCAGVSKVGSYTGNGSSQTINCGFTAGARFVMVKATSTTGNWIVADTNSIASDRALYMNNADREVSGNDWIDIASSGFIVNQTATIAANTNGVTYIFLAIA